MNDIKTHRLRRWVLICLFQRRGIGKKALLFDAVSVGAEVFEQQVDTPDARQRDDYKDDTADNGIHSAEEPAHQVELKEADKSPIQSADDNKGKC